MLLTIDPGVTTGWAVLDRFRVVACGCGDPRPSIDGRVIERVLIERPVIYPGRRTANPNDVLAVAIDAGRWAGRLERFGARIDYVEPATWKGQVPKAIHHARVWGALDASERSLVDVAGKGLAPSKRHNMLDAIGLGLYGLGRLRP